MTALTECVPLLLSGYVHEEHEYNKYGNRIEVSLNPDVTPEEKDKQLFQYDPPPPSFIRPVL